MGDADRDLGRSYHHGALRPALLKAAVTLIEESGAGEVSLRQVARLARVSHAAPYRHFTDKAALLDAVAEEGFVALGQAVGRALSDAQSAREKLRAGGVGYVRFALDHPGHYRVMFGPDTERPREGGPRGAGLRTFQILIDLVRDAQSVGEIAAGPAEGPALAVWSQAHGLAMLVLGGRAAFLSQAAPDALAGHAMDLVLRGLAP